MKRVTLAMLLVALSAMPIAAALPPGPEKPIALPLNPIVGAAQRLCTMRSKSGLGFKVLRAGAGVQPKASDVALVNYLGYLAGTGVVFDQNLSSVFPVEGVIPGFSEGLTMMPKGSIYRFCVPAALGYGPKGAGPIPPNADLVFQVELIDVKSKAEIEALQKAQGAAPQ
jgi:FKBP-type peptidyl-prolyl cis-trans isomerase FkpA